MRYTFEEEFRLDHPETVGEPDIHFDLENYKDWLEAQLIEARKQLALYNVVRSTFMFKQYRRKQIAELRPIEQSDLEQFEQHKMLVAHKTTDNWIPVSISDADLKAGSPKIGDMVA